MVQPQFRYICAHDIHEDSPVHRTLVDLWKSVERETDGQLVVEVLGWGRVGRTPVMLKKLRENQVQFHPISGIPLSSIVPVSAIECLPYAYQTPDEAFRVLDGALGNHVRAEISAKGLHVFQHIWPQGYQQITSRTRRIESAADFEGMRIRIAHADFMADLYGSLGAVPTRIHLQDIRPLLEKGEVDGVDMAPRSIELQRHYDFAKYLVNADIRWASFWMCANQDAWRALPDAVRSIVENAHSRFAPIARRAILGENEAALIRLRERGLEFLSPDRGSIKQRLSANGFYRRWRSVFGERAWQLLEEMRGPLS